MPKRDLIERGVFLLGCGRMGSALLKGWLKSDLPPQSIQVMEPYSSPWLQSLPVSLNPSLPETKPAVCVIAVKPQIFPEAVESIASFGGGETLVLSIAAGVRLNTISQAFGNHTPVIRAMPNTPASIGCGISALIGNDHADTNHHDLAEHLMSAVGATSRLERESQMDAVTALSGSGPAYVFHMIETMTAAGIQQGLAPTMALDLAKSTVAGAGRLAMESESHPSELREDVTSPKGTTAAALRVLMDTKNGLSPLMLQTISAAAERSRELGQTND